MEDLCSCLPQVLYLDVAPAQDGLGRLKAVTAATREHFLSQGLGSHEQRPFTPHVTIAKLSNLKSYGARKRVSRIPEVLASLAWRLQVQWSAKLCAEARIAPEEVQCSVEVASSSSNTVTAQYCRV